MPSIKGSVPRLVGTREISPEPADETARTLGLSMPQQVIMESAAIAQQEEAYRQTEKREAGVAVLEAAAVVFSTLLRVLSERFITLLRESVPLLALACAMTLWMRVMSNPSPEQLIGAGIFGVFALALVAILKR